MRLRQIQERAVARLRPRQRYARDVILGQQRWSGSDIRGKARGFVSYLWQRLDARKAFLSAGGELIALKSGLIVGATQTCTDDFGNVIYETTEGFARPYHGDRCELL